MWRFVHWGMLAFAAILAGGAEAQSFKDCASCPEMVPIPAGSFQMGPAPGEEEREGFTQEQRTGLPHRVAISAFAIGKYEVTKAEFMAFVTATGHFWSGRDGCPDFPQTEQDPVVCVHLLDATGYASWLSQTTGKTYRLPSEAEWEYAARAGSQTARFWGDSPEGACTYGNFADLTYAAKEGVKDTSATCTDGFAYTSPVGRFKPNAFGLHDMLGNVWEWTADCYNWKYDNAPADGSAWMEGDCNVRVLRGGSWLISPGSVRTASRYYGIIGRPDSTIGFRVVRDN